MITCGTYLSAIDIDNVGIYNHAHNQHRFFGGLLGGQLNFAFKPYHTAFKLDFGVGNAARNIHGFPFFEVGIGIFPIFLHAEIDVLIVVVPFLLSLSVGFLDVVYVVVVFATLKFVVIILKIFEFFFRNPSLGGRTSHGRNYHSHRYIEFFYQVFGIKICYGRKLADILRTSLFPLRSADKSVQRIFEIRHFRHLKISYTVVGRVFDNSGIFPINAANRQFHIALTAAQPHLAYHHIANGVAIIVPKRIHIAGTVVFDSQVVRTACILFRQCNAPFAGAVGNARTG